MGVMTLLGMSLTGALMVLVVIAVRAVALKRLPKTLFVALWLLVALRFCLPFAVSSPVSVLAALDRVAPEAARCLAWVAEPLPGPASEAESEFEPGRATSPDSGGEHATAGLNDGPATAYDATGADGTPAAMATTTATDGGASGRVTAESPDAAGAVGDAGDSGNATTSGGSASDPFDVTAPGVVGGAASGRASAALARLEPLVGLPMPVLALWGAGVLACSAGFGACWLRSRRRFAPSLPVEDAAALAMLAEERARVGLRRAVRLRSCDAIDTPLTYGLLRPRILVPAGMAWAQGGDGSVGERARLVLAHELTHVRNLDVAKKTVLAAALCLHWCNPLAWAMWVLANRDIELACDEAVVRRRGLGARGAYARALIDMEETRGRRGLAPLYSAFGSASLEERIVTIMHIKKTSAAAVLASALLVTGVPAALATTYAIDTGSGVTTVTSPIHPNSSNSPDTSSSADAGAASGPADAVGTSVASGTADTEDLLATYEPFGLEWELAWSETGGERTLELLMSWQDKQVASVYDERYGVWIANSLGRTLRANGAIDLVATYDASGRLTGLVKAEHVEGGGSTDVARGTARGDGASGGAGAPEAGSGQEATEVDSTASEDGDPRAMASWFAPYERFGLDYDERTGRLYYRDTGERVPVRTLVDYDGAGIFSFTDDQVADGLVLRTVYDASGRLTGLEEFDGDLAVFTEEP